MSTSLALSGQSLPPTPPLQARGEDARTDWTRDEIAALFDLPFTELLFRAAEEPMRACRAVEAAE